VTTIKSRVLDASGRPVELKVLTERQGEPGVTSVRSVWQPSVATGLTPSKLASILAAANDGDLHAYLTLAEEMEERDPHYASVLGIRKRAISGVEPIVKAASDDPRDQEIALAVKENIVKHHGFSDLVEDMLDSLGKGFSQVEIMWDKRPTEWRIEEFVHTDPRFFQFDRDTGKEIRLVDEADAVNGVALKPFKWIGHRAKLKSGLAFRGGLARLASFAYLCKAYTIKDWVAFIETYGLPLRIGRYGGEATPEDVKVLYRAVMNIGTDAAAVLPESMKIDFEQISAGPGNDIFEKFARWADEQTSKAVLGQTMTSDNGSSQSQAEVHNEVRHDIAKADAKSVCGSLNRDLVKPYVDLHYGTQDHYPEIKIMIEEAEDLDMVMTHTMEAADRGVKIKASEVRDKLGYSAPDDDDEILVPANQAQANQAPPQEPTTEARNRPQEVPARDPLDELQEELGGDWEDVMRGVLSPVMERLETAETYDDAQRVLAEAFPSMDVSPFMDALVKATVKARAIGEAENG